MSLTINGLTVATMRWRAPWSGVWTADIELTSDVDVLPTGPALIASDDGIALVGTVLTAEQFGEQRRIRVVGGAGGWSKPVRAQHYNSPAGVQLAVLAATTAATVGEAATVLVPQSVGTDFVRRDGPAAQIFIDAGVDWWVGPDGITRIGVRPPLVQPTTLQILNWDGEARTVSVSAEGLVEPGTILVDDRFGTKVVREVELDVDGANVNGTLWVEDSAASAGAMSELVDGLAALARQATRAEYARLYEYRVIAMAGDRVELQAVRPAVGMPDLLPASIWAGSSGYKASLAPSSHVLVGFIEGDPRRPYVAAYEPPENDGWRPVTLDLDALTFIRLGGDAATGVATLESMSAFMTLVATFASAVGAFVNAPAVKILATALAEPATAAAGALATGAALPTNFSTRVRAA